MEQIQTTRWPQPCAGLRGIGWADVAREATAGITLAALIIPLMTTIVAVFNLQEKGVSVLGSIPSGPPSISFPVVPAADYLRLLPGALAIVAITLCEGLLRVHQYSRKHRYKADGDQVLFALLKRYDLLELIGEDRLYPTNRHAVAALRLEQ